LRIHIYYIGKARDRHANAMAQEYVKRSSRFAKCDMREIQPARFDPWTRHSGASKILLDPGHHPMDSAGFTKLVAAAEADARDLVFIIGGADGFPAGWREKATLLLTLSALTLPHELARVILAEQIYRALTTLRGHPYPK
jgi:23S rRNA (pseudouridine1915-N3)-methyltransferase